MEGLEFWHKTLLRKFADDCIWHALIPTILSTRLGKWERIVELIDAQDDLVLRVQRANRVCVGCTKVLGDNDPTLLVLRVLVAKRLARAVPDDGHQYYIYRSVFHTASMCEPCANVRGYYLRLNSDTPMHNEVLDRLESLADDVAEDCMKDNLTGPQFWNHVLRLFHAHHADTMRALGLLDAVCGYCRTQGSKSRCSKCHIARYCGAECQLKDWPEHKMECAVLSKTSLFYTDKSVLYPTASN